MAEPFHCDFANQLFMGHLGNHMLNAADFHSNDRGFGMNYLNTIGKTWVLSRLAIETVEMPKSYTQFYIETWVESAMKYFTKRNFKITDAQTGKIYGYGRSIWAMIDTETRQPTNILDINDGDILKYVDKEKECQMAQNSRVGISDAARLARVIDTHYNDVDMNGHINSIKYIEHVLDLWDIEWYRKHQIRRFEVAYVAESHQGDKLCFYTESTAADAADNDKANEQEYGVRICKRENTNSTEADDERQWEETEVCRCKVTFAVIP